jgi:hypothetical protein
MGYWTNTTDLNHPSHQDVAAGLARLIEAEGRQRIDRPPARVPGLRDPMQYAGADDNALWGIAVFPGATGWTVIKTAPVRTSTSWRSDWRGTWAVPTASCATT